MFMPAKPVVLAMVPCVDVRRETPNSVATIIEALWSISVRELPTTLNHFKVYIALTAIHGSPTFRLRWGPVDQDERGYVMELTADTSSPLGAREIIADLHGWPLTQPGQWVLDLYFGGEILLSRRIEVRH